MFKRNSISNFPFSGFDRERLSIPGVELLSDDELREINEILDWKCFVIDRGGRRFGKPATASKRIDPQPIPDRRIELLNEKVNLSDKTVLEVGCFEGIHTVGLAQLAKTVKACDSRVTNVVKTAVRCAMFQVHPTIFLWDLEKDFPPDQNLDCDVLFHIGVLYHLLDPFDHLARILPFVHNGLLLDTHYATPEMVSDAYESGGISYRCYDYTEHGYTDPFSGMSALSRWVLLDDIIEFLSKSGMKEIEILEERQERNGPRMLLYATK